MGILDSDLRNRLLQMPDLTINLCIDIVSCVRSYREQDAIHGRQLTRGGAQYQTYTLSGTLDEKEDERSPTA